MPKIPVSVIILTKNEEAAISEAVRSVSSYDQVIVVDSCSTDATASVARNSGAEVIAFEWNGKYPKKKQWALENAPLKHDWVLFVDADERPSSTLNSSVMRAVRQPSNIAAYEVALRYVFMGQQLRWGHSVQKRALIDRRQCQFPEIDDLDVSNMWEVEGHYQPVADGPIGTLQGYLLHEDPDPLYDYFARHNRYSDWEAKLAVRTQRYSGPEHNARTFRGRIFRRLPGKPLAFFLYAYIARLGFLDGRPGFHYAIAQAFYYWQISVKTRESRNDAASTDADKSGLGASTCEYFK